MKIINASVRLAFLIQRPLNDLISCLWDFKMPEKYDIPCFFF